MNELKTYLEISEKLKADEALMKLIETYEAETKQLMDLVQNPDYDAQEAIRLTNDVEYMSDTISRNELYCAFVDAKEKLENALREKAIMSMPCSCNCSTCSSDCSSREHVHE